MSLAWASGFPCCKSARRSVISPGEEDIETTPVMATIISLGGWFVAGLALPGIARSAGLSVRQTSVGAFHCGEQAHPSQSGGDTIVRESCGQIVQGVFARDHQPGEVVEISAI